MDQAMARLALRGAAAGLGASIVQSAIGKTEDLFLLPSHENADIAPRFAHRVSHALDVELSDRAEWILGTAFHLGYGASWGALYALASERFRLPAWAGGLALGGVIYGITFPRWGVAVRTGTERPPAQRTRQMQLVTVSVAFGFGLVTTLLDRELARRARPAPTRSPPSAPQPSSRASSAAAAARSRD